VTGADPPGGVDRHSGVSLVDAVAASTSSGVADGIGEERYIDELRAGGSRVETVLPDRASLDAFGSDLMDPSTRRPAARAGYEQGRLLAEQVSDFWS